MSTFGLDVSQRRVRDFISGLDITTTNLIVVRVSREDPIDAWDYQTLARIVLTPSECRDLAVVLARLAREATPDVVSRKMRFWRRP